MAKTKQQWIDYIRSVIKSTDKRIDTLKGPVYDAFINPMAISLSSLDSEIERVLEIIDINNFALMTDEEFDGFLSNFLMSIKDGTPTRGTVYFMASSLNFDITIPIGFPVSTSVGLSTPLLFYTVESKTMFVANKSAYFNPNTGFYEIAVAVESVAKGNFGEIPAGSVNIMVRTLSGIDRVENRSNFIPGSDVEDREDAVKRLKSFIKSSGSLLSRSGIKFSVLNDVESAVVIGDGDSSYDRGVAGGVDVFVIGENLETVTDYFIVGYKYLEDPANGIVWIFNNQPVKSIEEVIIDGIDRTSWFSLQKDSGVNSNSIRGKDALFISNPSSLNPYFGKTASVTYKYNSLIGSVQLKMTGEDKRVFGQDLLIREASKVNIVISMTLTYFSGYDQSAVKNSVKQAVIDYINDLDIGDDVERSDVIFVIKSVPGVDNVVFSDFRKSTDAPGTVYDIPISIKEYARTDNTLVTVT